MQIPFGKCIALLVVITAIFLIVKTLSQQPLTRKNMPNTMVKYAFVNEEN